MIENCNDGYQKESVEARNFGDEQKHNQRVKHRMINENEKQSSA